LLPPPSGAVGGAPTRGDQCGWRRPNARRSVPPARPCAVSAALPAVRRCAARRSDSPFCGRRATPAGRRRCGGDGGPPSPPHILPATAAWLYVPPYALVAMDIYTACPVSMRRRARHRPEGQSIARSAWNWILGSTSSKTLSTMYSDRSKKRMSWGNSGS